MTVLIMAGLRSEDGFWTHGHQAEQGRTQQYYEERGKAVIFVLCIILRCLAGLAARCKLYSVPSLTDPHDHQHANRCDRSFQHVLATEDSGLQHPKPPALSPTPIVPWV